MYFVELVFSQYNLVADFLLLASYHFQLYSANDKRQTPHFASFNSPLIDAHWLQWNREINIFHLGERNRFTTKRRFGGRGRDDEIYISAHTRVQLKNIGQVHPYVR